MLSILIIVLTSFSSVSVVGISILRVKSVILPWIVSFVSINSETIEFTCVGITTTSSVS